MKFIANDKAAVMASLTVGATYEGMLSPVDGWVDLVADDTGNPQSFYAERFDTVAETSPGLEKHRPLRANEGAEYHEPELRDPKEKDTNPKAAIGVRKVPFSVIPMDVMAEVGLAMLEGSAKYGRHNYRAAGARASVYFDGTMRHLVQWWEGEDIDPDTLDDDDPDVQGVNHITKAIASLTVLRAAMLAGKFEDDRPPRTMQASDWTRMNRSAGALIDKHKAKTPKHYTEKQ